MATIPILHVVVLNLDLRAHSELVIKVAEVESVCRGSGGIGGSNDGGDAFGDTSVSSASLRASVLIWNSEVWKCKK